MYHYLAKIGRNPNIKGVVPLLGVSITVGYVGVHFFSHKFIRNVFAAESAPGKREEISKDLQRLIMEVYDDIKHSFNKPAISSSIFQFRPAPIKWFCSSTIDPISLGMTETRTGILVGLPNHYNFTKPEDVPSTFKNVKLFKSFSKKSKQEESNEDSFAKCDAEDCRANVLVMDKENPDWQKYVDSMILSDNAKKFSIARELFMCDSYRVLAIAGIIMLSSMISISLSRAAVSKLAIADAHLTQRVPFYILSGTVGMLNYYLVGDAINQYYTRTSDMKAISVSESYKQGAIEYFTKIKQRNLALKSLVEDLGSAYDEDGNKVEPLLRKINITIDDRLKSAKNTPVSATSKAD